MIGKLNGVDWAALTLLLLGGVNWGLVGLNGYLNVVEYVFGDGRLTDLLYVLIGASALYWIYRIARK